MIFSRLLSSQVIRLAGIVLLVGTWTGSAVGQSVEDTDPTLAMAFAEVDQLRSEGSFRAALDSLQRLRRTHPNHTGVLYRLAFLWSDVAKETDDESRSVTHYRRSLSAAEAALEADPESAWAHLALALAQGRLALHVSTRERVRRSRAVKTHVDRAIALDSTLAGAYHLRGRWHRSAADLSFLARTVVQVVYGGLPDASFEQAVADFRRAIALETRTYHHLELGKTYRKMGKVEAARSQFRTALKVSPVGPFAPEQKAEARTLLKQQE